MTAIAVKESELRLRNAYTRMPFRYGSACLTACPQAILKVVVECDGVVQAGYSGDALPPGWFDKRPGVPYRQQIADQIAVIGVAQSAFREGGAFAEVWQDAYRATHTFGSKNDFPELLASFGHSMVERAVIDAICRAKGLSFHDAVRSNAFDIDPGRVSDELSGLSFADWLPARAAECIHVRHTVGLVDPLTPDEVPVDERLDDGLPQSFQEYVQHSGLRHFKIKVSNELDRDVERLMRVAAIVEAQRGNDYVATLDGNEQYKAAQDFEALIEGIRATPELATFWNNVLAIEQPLHRSIALDPAHTGGVRALSESKPVIIDESDGSLDAYAKALDLGYRGVSSKACKGPIKSLVNAGLTWLRNDRGARREFLMTGEDLTCVGMVSLQTDLALVATLGLTHVERNGHHYYRGLAYLPKENQAAIEVAHSDLYTQIGDTVCVRIDEGALNIGSIQRAGFGFGIEPNLTGADLAEDWQFDSLGLDDE